MEVGFDDIIILNINCGYSLKFHYSLKGCTQDKLKCAFVIQCKDVEYSFGDWYVQHGIIHVDIPPLKKVIPKGISGKFGAVLKVVADDIYLSPWTGIIEISTNPLMKASPEVDNKEETTSDKKHQIDVADIKGEVLSELTALIEKKIEDMFATIEQSKPETKERIKFDLLRQLVAQQVA